MMQRDVGAGPSSAPVRESGPMESCVREQAGNYHHIANSRMKQGQTCIRRLEGAGVVRNPNICVAKMAHTNFSFTKFFAIVKPAPGGWGEESLGRGFGTEPSKLAALLAAGSVNRHLSPITKISTRPSFAKVYLGHEDSPSCCVGPPFLFLHGGGSWHQHIKRGGGGAAPMVVSRSNTCFNRGIQCCKTSEEHPTKKLVLKCLGLYVAPGWARGSKVCREGWEGT